MRSMFLILPLGLAALAQQKAPERTVPMEPLPAAVAAPKAKVSGTFEDSLRRQAESIGRQMQTLQEQYPAYWKQTVTVEAGPEPVQTAQCPPMPRGELQDIVDREAKRHQMSSILIHAVIEQESANLPCAVSNKGAMGLMQLMPGTAQTLNVKDPFDPAQNIAGGSRFLKSLLTRYNGDLSKALAAYNAGPGRVDQAGDIPDIPETQQYVEKILARVALKESAIQ